MAVEITKGKPHPPSRFLIMGEPFSGKTTLAAKAPKPLFISTDGNAAKAGLDAVNVESVQDVRDALALVHKHKEYKTVVIDTIEGVVDMLTSEVLAEYQNSGYKTADGGQIQSLQDVPFGKATGNLNSRVEKLANSLAKVDRNIIIISYTKRRIDDVSGSIVLDSELKNIRFFTRFMDVQILTSYDGEKHKAEVIGKRETMAGDADLTGIKDFLNAAGWERPKRSVKLGSTK